ncbi:MAG: gas vesicle protein GvpG [Candidatus Schekmanbacteria bacterium]|nr:gas vesicle protein GvpG [Candidatus Schekmanbacteria bacterium]
MFLIDDILLFPTRSLFWVFRNIHDAAAQELAQEAGNITVRLNELYMMLETKQITEEEFDAREKELLDRLDKLRENGTLLEDETDEEETDETEEQTVPLRIKAI